MRGDIDGDGKITQNDVDQINKHVGGIITLTGADLWCADTTGDNKVNITDFVQLSRYPEGKTTTLTSTPTFADYYNNWTYHKVDDLTGYWTAEVAINGLKATSDAIVNISNDEGIFYKSELSDGAIRFYATRPPITEVSATVTFKSGTGVITTSYESAKFHAATHSKDGADPITPTAIGAVGYDAAQNLTDAQKTQVRGNIGAAPAGYGLGGDSKILTSADNLDTLMTGGLFQYSRDNPPKGALPTVLAGYASLIRVSAAGNTCVQEAYDPTDSSLHGTVLRRTVYGLNAGAKIYPWEWVNPPMQLGVEYRTTERVWGRPVYYKIVDCGQIADNKQVEHGIMDMRDCIFCQGLRGAMPMPSISNNDLSDPWSYYVADVSRTKITLACGTSAAGGNCHVILKYTKTTD